MRPRVVALTKRFLLPFLGVALAAALALQVRQAGANPEGASAPAPSSAPSRVVAEGRLVAYPGAEVTVGSDLAGTVARVAVAEKQSVRRGELLVELRADDLAAELSEARARRAEAEADVRLFELEVARAERLVAERVESVQSYDRARRNHDAARARRSTAEAAVTRLAAVLDKTRLRAPIAGVVLAREVDPGETIEAGETLLTLADLSRTRIEAEVDEFDVGRMALGAAVTVTAEGFEGLSWSGRIEEIPDAVVGRRLKPQDPGRPSDTRVLLVKIALDEPTPLKLGQRVEVAIAGSQVSRSTSLRSK